MGEGEYACVLHWLTCLCGRCESCLGLEWEIDRNHTRASRDSDSEGVLPMVLVVCKTCRTSRLFHVLAAGLVWRGDEIREQEIVRQALRAGDDPSGRCLRRTGWATRPCSRSSSSQGGVKGAGSGHGRGDLREPRSKEVRDNGTPLHLWKARETAYCCTILRSDALFYTKAGLYR